MAKRPNERRIVEKFVDSYLERVNTIPTLESLLTNLISDGITDPERLRNYMIVNDYYELLGEYDHHIGDTIKELSKRYGITTRQIQNILYKWSHKFKECNNVVG